MESDEYNVFGCYKVGSVFKREQRKYHAKSFENASVMARKDGLVQGIYIEHPIGEPVFSAPHNLKINTSRPATKIDLMRNYVLGIEPVFDTGVVRDSKGNLKPKSLEKKLDSS